MNLVNGKMGGMEGIILLPAREGYVSEPHELQEMK